MYEISLSSNSETIFSPKYPKSQKTSPLQLKPVIIYTSSKNNILSGQKGQLRNHYYSPSISSFLVKAYLLQLNCEVAKLGVLPSIN